MTEGLAAPGAESATRFDKLRKADARDRKARSNMVLRRAARGGPALPKTKAKTRYSTLNKAYTTASDDLMQAISADSTDTAQLRAAVRQAADAYDARLAALAATSWPAAAQPYVDNYLELARTVGHDLYSRARKAKTVDDLRHPTDVHASFQLSRAERLMSAKLAPGS